MRTLRNTKPKRSGKKSSFEPFPQKQTILKLKQSSPVQRVSCAYSTQGKKEYTHIFAEHKPEPEISPEVVLYLHLEHLIYKY